MRHGQGAATSAVVAVVGVVTLLVAWAASIGPDAVLRRGPEAQRYDPTPTVSDTPAVAGSGLPRVARQLPDPPWLGALLVVLEVALALVLAYLLYRLVRHLVRAMVEVLPRLRPGPTAAVVGFEVLETPAALARAITRDAEAHRRVLLAGGTPRHAILACWQRFEAQAAEVGITRQPWQTSSEFTLRILDEVEADSRAVTRLAGLYREARHSRHELGEEARTAALVALDEVHRGLRQRTGGGP